MSSIAAELRKLKTKYYELVRVRKHLDDLNKNLKKEYKQLDKLEKKMNKEFKEYDNLEGKSIKGFFYKVLGNKEKQIEKERQDYIQASLKYEEYRKSVELLEYEIDVLAKKSGKLEQIEDRYQQLIVRREKELLRGNKQAGKRLLKIIRQKEKNEQLLHEIKKTAVLGEKSQKILGEIIRHLRTAKNWGNWDMYGRGRQSGWVKHSNMDRAKDLSYHAQHALGRFENALTNIYGRRQAFNFSIHVDTFSRFTDIFFDNLISDWIIQQKITNTLNSVRSVNDKVTRVRQSLQTDYDNLKAENKQLEKDRKKLIEQS